MLTINTAREKASRTITKVLGLSPPLEDEDDGDKDDHLHHDAEEGPQGGQPAAHAQHDDIRGLTHGTATLAGVAARVCVTGRVMDVQGGLVGQVLDIVLFVLGDFLRVTKDRRQKFSCRYTDVIPIKGLILLCYEADQNLILVNK